MEQLVSFPTYLKGNVRTNIPERAKVVVEVGRLGKSNHVVIVPDLEAGIAMSS
jgi:hypothetical protein